MSEPATSKPLPARLADGVAGSGTVKPTPARDLARAEPREDAPFGAAVGPPSAPQAVEPDIEEVALESDGASWRVRVIGRSGTGGRSVPLLTLGFYDPARPDGPPALEATVVGRTLAQLTEARLAAALAEARPPQPPDRKKPFFEGLGQARRGGGAQRDG